MNKGKRGCDVVIFCGGRGTRLSEWTREMPKPLIELGKAPILWHIMKIYEQAKYRKFILALGYKGEMIEDYFLHRYKLTKDFELDTKNKKITNISEKPRFYNNIDNHRVFANEAWRIAFVETGLGAKTATRLLRCREYIHTSPFMVTYGDGVADIDLGALLARHRQLRKEHGVIGTITITHPYSKYGITSLRSDLVERFQEKPLMNEYINVGFMVLEDGIFDYISEREDVMFEETLQQVAADGLLGYYIHDGFWHAMDTYKDYEDLNRMWKEGPQWKIWSE